MLLYATYKLHPENITKLDFAKRHEKNLDRAHRHCLFILTARGWAFSPDSVVWQPGSFLERPVWLHRPLQNGDPQNAKPGGAEHQPGFAALSITLIAFIRHGLDHTFVGGGWSPSLIDMSASGGRLVALKPDALFKTPSLQPPFFHHYLYAFCFV